MKVGSAAATVRQLEADTIELCRQAEAALEGTRPDLAVVFFTSHFEEEAETIIRAIVRRYPSCLLIGCSAEGVIGHDRELERLPAVSLLLAHLPDVRLQPFRVSPDQIMSPDAEKDWGPAVGAIPGDSPTFLLLGDPFTVPINRALSLFNRVYPGRPVVGGMASGCERPGQAVLVLDDQVCRDGVIGVALSGALEVETVVSQGCRPIGTPFVITRCDRHILHELGGAPAGQRLREMLETLSDADTALARESLFVGRVINEYKERFARGDFLIRSIMGMDPRSGALAVSDEMRVGATVQFHVRDAASADEDLRQMLAPYQDAGIAGALLFSCNGRGTRMWSRPNHDVAVLREVCGPVAVGGFFAAGELGPVGGRSFIHGHTASIALLRAAV